MSIRRPAAYLRITDVVAPGRRVASSVTSSGVSWRAVQVTRPPERRGLRQRGESRSHGAGRNCFMTDIAATARRCPGDRGAVPSRWPDTLALPTLSGSVERANNAHRGVLRAIRRDVGASRPAARAGLVRDVLQDRSSAPPAGLPDHGSSREITRRRVSARDVPDPCRASCPVVGQLLRQANCSLNLSVAGRACSPWELVARDGLAQV